MYMEGKDRLSPWSRSNQGKVTGEKVRNDKEAFANAFQESIAIQRVEGFRAALVRRGGTYTETLRVNPDGYLDVSGEDSLGPDLLSCSPADKKVIKTPEVNTTIIRYTPDSLRAGAKELMNIFPELTFDFSEDAERRIFTWTVRLAGGTV